MKKIHVIFVTLFSTGFIISVWDLLRSGAIIPYFVDVSDSNQIPMIKQRSSSPVSLIVGTTAIPSSSPVATTIINSTTTTTTTTTNSTTANRNVAPTTPMTTNKKGSSSCYKTRLRMVYPSYGTNGCNHEFSLPENHVLGRGYHRAYCRFYQYKIQLSSIRFINYGGEKLTDVIGQPEDNEYIQYQSDQTFIITENRAIQPQESILQEYRRNVKHYISDVLSHTTIKSYHNITSINDSSYSHNYDEEPKCTHIINGTTYLIRRYEYVNLYHTLTDWWNTWLAMDSIEAQYEQQQQQNNSINVNDHTDHNHQKQIVFLDSHPQGQLDGAWADLFTHYSYIGQYVTTKPSSFGKLFTSSLVSSNDVLCLEDAVLVPAGYDSEFSYAWYDDTICRDHIAVERFVNYVLDHYQLHHIERKLHHFIYIDRRPYVSHPRVNMASFSRVVTNLDHVALQVQQYVDTTFQINSTYEIIQLDQHTMYEQIYKIRTAHILFGYHGAGLTHLLFLHDDSGVIEITHASGGNLFDNMAKWKQKERKKINEVEERMVVENAIYHKMIPSLYSTTVDDDYIKAYVFRAFHSIIEKQQENEPKFET